MIPNQAQANAKAQEIVNNATNPANHEPESQVPIAFAGTLRKRRDVHEGPGGAGSSFVFWYEAEGKTYAREMHAHGPENWRTSEWAELIIPPLK